MLVERLQKKSLLRKQSEQVDWQQRQNLFYSSGNNFCLVASLIVYKLSFFILIQVCCDANGKFLPMYVLFKAKNMYDSWTRDGPDNCHYNVTPNGLMDTEKIQRLVQACFSGPYK